MSKRIWITWENQRRNITISSALNASLFQFDLNLNRFSRYSIGLIKTIATLMRERPRLIFVQNPSLVLALFAINYGRILNIPIVVDAHNAGIYPFEGRKPWANRIAAYLMRKADLTIVTNEYLAEYVQSKGGKPSVLPDPIPTLRSVDSSESKKILKGKHNVIFICTYANDEPLLEVIKAARLLNNDTYVYISGDSKGKEGISKEALPSNVVLTGYLSDEEFIQMLRSADLVMDLTTRKDCLVCGAYEAIAMEKPLIISGNAASKKYFSMGTLYTDNTYTNIAELINKAILNRDRLTNEVRVLKRKLIQEWNERKDIFEKVIQKFEHGNRDG